MSARVVQINVSPGGVPKTAVPAVNIGIEGLEGDRQANPGIHGGRERAVSLWSAELIARLREEGHPIFPGCAGENLTISGLDWSRILPGRRLRIGTQVVLEITRFITPCRTISPCFAGDEVTRIHEERHPGWSRVAARVIAEGKVKIGDEVVLAVPHRGRSSST